MFFVLQVLQWLRLISFTTDLLFKNAPYIFMCAVRVYVPPLLIYLIAWYTISVHHTRKEHNASRLLEMV